MNLIREKEALERTAARKNQNPERPIDSRAGSTNEEAKEQIAMFKQKEA